ncbi:hypothetical protein [Mucilaginibacter sp.]|uniref:hypothetical protein n=1 Tax=Mucilaginibacter sp. TaxID=1882438 RepID=UPI000CBFDF47|nr:hypothetical protein [Mucilaginibacter sp.]PLW90436.1 MAG: hypothetical protein C0154_06490 [Mucilaginibacter sp.]HEK20173.1 hypothetical protein [Bacteroidota bacterium]
MTTTEQLSNERLQLLCEALELLEDMKIKMALFERQYYSKLKAKASKVVGVDQCDHSLSSDVVSK